MRRSVCLFAGLLCVAAVLHCGPVAAQEPNVPATDLLSTEKPTGSISESELQRLSQSYLLSVQEYQRYFESLSPEEHIARMDEVYLRHVDTYDLPHNNNPWEPHRMFVLQVFTRDSGKPYSDIMLYTNVGMGMLRNYLGNSMANRWDYIEILCYSKEYGDDCNPDKVIIYDASATPGHPENHHHKRGNIIHKLRSYPNDHLPIVTPHGALVPSPVSTVPVNKQIKVAFQGQYSSHGQNTVVRLTFPPGQLQAYKKIHLSSTEWTSDEWSDDNEKTTQNKDRPDSLRVYLSPPETDVYTDIEPSYKDPDRPESLRNEDFLIFIRDAYVWTKNTKNKRSKKINIIPYLVEDTFRMLPIHGPDGLLPSDNWFDVL